MTEISQRQLRNDNAEIMRRLEHGESFTVTRHGRRVGELRSVAEGDGDPFVDLDGLSHDAGRLPRVDYQAFRRDLDAFADSAVEL